MRCPGFVQVSQIVTLGGAYNPVSVYNGTQRSIEIYIFRVILLLICLFPLYDNYLHEYN